MEIKRVDHPGDKLKHKDYDSSGSKLFDIEEEINPPTKFDLKLANYHIMKKMRERFGEKWYNSERLFPDPRKPQKPIRKLKMG